MKTEKIKPIPKYIIERICKKDKNNKQAGGKTRFYSYLTTNNKELVKITVAVKTYKGKLYFKQCAVHGINSDTCFVKDMIFYYIGGYFVGWYDMGIQRNQKWYEDSKWYKQEACLFDPYSPIVNTEYIGRFNKYKYSAYELYDGTKIIQYLQRYEKYPQMEYLMKLGLSKLSESTVILRQIGKDKRFCKWLIANKEELKKSYHYIASIIRAYKTNRPLNEIQMLAESRNKFIHNRELYPLKELFKGKDLERFFLYIAEQEVSYNSYLDYYNACNFLHMNMTLDKNLFPHDFNRWHDIRIDEYKTAKAELDAKTRAELYTKFGLIAEKYMPLQYTGRCGLVMVIAKSPKDLINEGESLHHCVGKMGFDQKMVREETLIFFVREKTKIETPLVTVEYSPQRKKILQCHADHNARPTEEILHYINKIWLPYANRTIKKLLAA